MKKTLSVGYAEAIAQGWKQRREACELKKGSKKERDFQLEYVIGALKGLEAAGVPIVGLQGMALLVSCGRDIVDEYGR